MALDDLGRVVLLARRAGVTGIFGGPDPAADKVIATGDELFRSTVTQLAFHRYGLNDRRQIAFAASLADGRRVVVRAEP